MWFQKEIILESKKRGFHVVTDEILVQLSDLNRVNIGILHLFIKHTSASLTINENADPSVRIDLESHFNIMVPENAHYYKHTYEGSDDMPAHLKSSLLGTSLSIPVTSGRLQLGIWQGVYLCEHRNSGGNRTIIATIHGE